MHKAAKSEQIAFKALCTWLPPKSSFSRADTLEWLDTSLPVAALFTRSAPLDDGLLVFFARSWLRERLLDRDSVTWVASVSSSPIEETRLGRRVGMWWVWGYWFTSKMKVYRFRPGLISLNRRYRVWASRFHVLLCFGSKIRLRENRALCQRIRLVWVQSNEPFGEFMREWAACRGFRRMLEKRFRVDEPWIVKGIFRTFF